MTKTTSSKVPAVVASVDENDAQHGATPKSIFMIAIQCLLLAIATGGIWQVINLYEATSRNLSHFIFYLAATICPLLLLATLAAANARREEKLKNHETIHNRLESIKNRMDNREDLMRVIADHQPGAVMIFDRENRFWFLNKRALDSLAKSLPDIIGRPPMRVYTNETDARRIEIRLAETRALETSRNYVDQVTDSSGNTRFIQSHYEILGNLPELPQAVLVSEEDLTPMIIERERRSRMLRQVIDTLVAVVDRRDPYAAGHSAKVGQLAQIIAVEMGLGEKDIEAAEISGSLMNFGKVLVPREILTKTTPLTSEELQRVRDSILTSADILSIIGFDAPVVPTLRHIMERYDGTGAPDGLKGEEILLTARIVALANAFVALVSPRAHRDGLMLRDAVQRVQQEAGKAFDSKVIQILARYIENYPNRLDWLVPSKQL